VTVDSALADLPPELRSDAVVVRSGDDLLRLVEQS